MLSNDKDRAISHEDESASSWGLHYYSLFERIHIFTEPAQCQLIADHGSVKLVVPALSLGTIQTRILYTYTRCVSRGSDPLRYTLIRYIEGSVRDLKKRGKIF